MMVDGWCEMKRLERDLAKIGVIAGGVVLAIGAVIGIVIDTLIHHIRDEGISEHFRKD